jgi:hypothetical protein
MRHQGKYGWYPCDIETYHKLKKLNMAYDKALHEKAAWDRWDRKEPQNRVIRGKLKNSSGQIVGYQAPLPMPEPELTSIFCKKVVKKVTWGKKGQFYKDGKEETFVELTDLPIYEDYYRARYPVVGEEGVSPLSMKLDLINELHGKLVNMSCI